MKRIISFALLLGLFAGITGIKAVSFPDQLPGGKNYLDPENFEVNNGDLTSIENVLLKSDTWYTLSIPGIPLGSGIEVGISGIQTGYVQGPVDDNTRCTVTTEKVTCLFQTDNIEEFVDIRIMSPKVATYFENNAMLNMQLEEGTISTPYEPYVSPVMDVTLPEFSGSGAYVKSYDTNITLSTIISDHIYAYDDIDGDISDQIVVETDGYSGNENTVGMYDCVLSVKDSSNNTAYFNLTVVVKDEKQPVINGPSALNIGLSNTSDILDIINEKFIYFDEYDQHPSLTVMADDFTPNKSVIGNYNVKFMVSDSSENVTIKTFVITVIDDISPVVTSPTMYTSYLSNPTSNDDILNSLVYSDETDLAEDITVTILMNEYASNQNNPGVYEIMLEIKDTSMNQTIHTIEVNVIDDVNPSIDGPNELSLSYQNLITLNEILEQFILSDNVDIFTNQDLVVTSDTYSSNIGELGAYQVQLQLTDRSGNQVTHTLQINIIDDVIPVIYVDDYIITIDAAVTFTKNDVIKLLMSSNEIPANKYEVTELLNDYSGNENKPGMYSYKVLLTSEDGQEYEKDFVVKVVSEEEQIDKDVLVRNVISYSFVIIVFMYVIYKQK